MSDGRLRRRLRARPGGHRDVEVAGAFGCCLLCLRHQPRSELRPRAPGAAAEPARRSPGRGAAARWWAERARGRCGVREAEQHGGARAGGSGRRTSAAAVVSDRVGRRPRSRCSRCWDASARFWQRSFNIGIVGHEYLALDRCAPSNQRGPRSSLQRGFSVGGWRLHGHARTAPEVATNKRYIARWFPERDSSSVARSSSCSGCGSPAPGGAS